MCERLQSPGSRERRGKVSSSGNLVAVEAGFIARFPQKKRIRVRQFWKDLKPRALDSIDWIRLLKASALELVMR